MAPGTTAPPPAKKPRPSLEGSAYDPNTLTNTLRSQLKAYALLANKLDSTLKDVNQVHSELDVDNKPINLVKGRLDRLYDTVGEETGQEIKRLDSAIETLDILINMSSGPSTSMPPLPSPALASVIAATPNASTSSPLSHPLTATASASTSAVPSPANSAAGKKRGPYKKKDKGDVGSRAGSPTANITSATASPIPAYSTSPSATSPTLVRTASGKGIPLSASAGKGVAPSVAANSSAAVASGSKGPSTPSTPSGSTSGATKKTNKSKKDTNSASAANLPFYAQLPLGPGRQVAFRQSSKVPGEEKMDEWILARVISSLGGDKHRYQIEDVDYDVNNPTPEQGKYNTTTKSIIPLPDRSDPKTYPDRDLVPGQAVIALYPDTTSFYRAFVESGPLPAPGTSGKKKNQDRIYKLKFDDDGDVIRDIAQELILEAP